MSGIALGPGRSGRRKDGKATAVGHHTQDLGACPDGTGSGIGGQLHLQVAATQGVVTEGTAVDHRGIQGTAGGIREADGGREIAMPGKTGIDRPEGSRAEGQGWVVGIGDVDAMAAGDSGNAMGIANLKAIRPGPIGGRVGVQHL